MTQHQLEQPGGVKRRYVVLGLAVVAALSLAITPAGAAPVNLAAKALGLAKKADTE